MYVPFVLKSIINNCDDYDDNFINLQCCELSFLSFIEMKFD